MTSKDFGLWKFIQNIAFYVWSWFLQAQRWAKFPCQSLANKYLRLEESYAISLAYFLLCCILHLFQNKILAYRSYKNSYGHYDRI